MPKSKRNRTNQQESMTDKKNTNTEYSRELSDVNERESMNDLNENNNNNRSNNSYKSKNKRDKYSK